MKPIKLMLAALFGVLSFTLLPNTPVEAVEQWPHNCWTALSEPGVFPQSGRGGCTEGGGEYQARVTCIRQSDMTTRYAWGQWEWHPFYSKGTCGTKYRYAIAVSMFGRCTTAHPCTSGNPS